MKPYFLPTLVALVPVAVILCASVAASRHLSAATSFGMESKEFY